MHHTSSSTYTLPSGRTVFLSRLLMSQTYAGILEGTPEIVSEHISRSLTKNVQQAMSPGTPLVIIGDQTSVLPPLQWIAEFHSSRGVHTNDPDYNSHLFVCWFTEGIPNSFSRMIADILAAIDWEAQAEDYDIMP